VKTRLLCLGAALLLTGCGGGVDGTYVGGNDSVLQSMTFKSGGKVDVALVTGVGGEGTYEVDGNKVRVSANGTTTELTIGDDHCLHGPLGIGTLCKGGKPAASAGVGSGAHTTGNLPGSTFEAAANGGRMSLQFAADQKVRVSTVAPGSAEGNGWVEGTYTLAGNQVVVTIQGEPAIFTYSGNTLSGSLGGDHVTFTRK
jgi:hypothetical protein